MDPSIMKNFEIASLQMWERSWLDKMRTVELNPWTPGRLTNPRERTKMSMQFNSVVRTIDPIRNRSKSPTTSENPSIARLPLRHRQHHVNRLQRTRNRGVMRRNRVQAGKKRLICYVVESAIPPDYVNEVGTEPSSDADSDLFGLDWCDDPIATINSLTERNDRTRGEKELLAFVDSGAVDNVLPQTVCTEYPLEATSKSQSGVGFKGANGSHINHYGQRRLRVKTSAGSNVNTTWEVVDVRKPLISASRLLERGHKLVLDEKPRIQCKNGETNRIVKRKRVRPYTEEAHEKQHTLSGLSLMLPTGSELTWMSPQTPKDLEERGPTR